VLEKMSGVSCFVSCGVSVGPQENVFFSVSLALPVTTTVSLWVAKCTLMFVIFLYRCGARTRPHSGTRVLVENFVARLPQSLTVWFVDDFLCRIR
jgi:hypothetical protein